MNEKKEFNISLSLDRHTAVKALNDQILAGIRQGYNAFNISVKKTATYSNVCAPVAGILDYYKRQGCIFTLYYEESPYIYASHTQIDAPKVAEDFINTVELNYPFDKVWIYSSTEGVNALVNSYIKALRQQAVLEDGVIRSLDWCLNESMDNVLQHSSCDHGYVMAQFHALSKQFSVCVFDTGVGIYNTLKSSKHNPSTPLDAITMAMQERVTRDERIGQGNGLWGLSKLISEGNGIIRICSAGASYLKQLQQESTIATGYFNLGKQHGTTLVDFQLNCNNEINITKALNGYEGLVDYWVENLENNNGDIELSVAEHSSGTGTRKAAEKFRNLILNLVVTDQKKVVLDFSGVNIVSSSYADELIGKIISQYGFMFFVSKIEIKNLSSFNVSVVNRSVGQRLAQTYYDKEIKDINDEF